MNDYILDYFSIFNKTSFIVLCCEVGIIITLFFYFICVIIGLLLFPFLLLIYPFWYLNFKSKNWFRKDDISVKVQSFKRSKNS